MNGEPLEVLLRRDRWITGAALAMLTTLAWAYMLWLAHGMASDPAMSMPDMDMSGMGSMAADSAPWGLARFAFVFFMWVVMMAGMMTPSAAPMVLLYARVGRQATAQGTPFAGAGWFLGGYLLAWTIFALAAAMAQWGLERAALLTPMMEQTSQVFGGVVLIAAGIYQWSPLKHACLRQCQTPLLFIQRHGGFRRSAGGSLALGARHGLYCVGCCWALMSLLFVSGVMNVLWIAAISIFVLVEKLVPAARVIPRLAGAGFVASGAWLLAAALR